MPKQRSILTMSLKHQLLMQSLSPLMFLTIIKNFKFDLTEDLKEFISKNVILLIVLVLCSIWILASICCFVTFNAFKWSNKETGYTVEVVEEDKQTSLEFVLTIIIPLLVGDVATLQGALTFLILLLIICKLLNNTDLFYANPILKFLGYHLYKFKFYDNEEYHDKTVIGLCRGKIIDMDKRLPIEYKIISPEDKYALYFKEVKK